MATSLAWVMLILGAMTAGAATVGLLGLKRSREPFMLIGGMLSMAVCGTGLASIAGLYSRPEATAAAAFISLRCIGGGYGLA